MYQGIRGVRRPTPVYDDRCEFLTHKVKHKNRTFLLHSKHLEQYDDTYPLEFCMKKRFKNIQNRICQQIIIFSKVCNLENSKNK
jgi:hypothetical protein